MTPQEILADLRDIHLPEAATADAASGLVLWPLALVLLAALMVAWLIRRRRSVWRQDFLKELDRIEQAAERDGGIEGWARLAHLLRRLAIQRQGKAEIAGLSGEPWLRRLDDVIGADLFTSGPGRGLITFPYLGVSLDDDVSRRIGDDLKATIASLRDRTRRLGSRRWA